MMRKNSRLKIIGIVVVIFISILGVYSYVHYIGVSKTLEDTTLPLNPGEEWVIQVSGHDECIHYQIQSQEVPLVVLVMDPSNYFKLEDNKQFYYYTSDSVINTTFAEGYFKANKPYYIIVYNPTNQVALAKIKVKASSASANCPVPTLLKEATLPSFSSSSIQIIENKTMALKPLEEWRLQLSGYGCVKYRITSIEGTPLLFLVTNPVNFIKMEKGQEFYYYNSNSAIGTTSASGSFEDNNPYDLIILNPTNHTALVKIKVATAPHKTCSPPNYPTNSTLLSLVASVGG